MNKYLDGLILFLEPKQEPYNSNFFDTNDEDQTSEMNTNIIPHKLSLVIAILSALQGKYIINTDYNQLLHSFFQYVTDRIHRDFTVKKILKERRINISDIDRFIADYTNTRRVQNLPKFLIALNAIFGLNILFVEDNKKKIYVHSKEKCDYEPYMILTKQDRNYGYFSDNKGRSLFSYFETPFISQYVNTT